jgi:hypothetical protein
VKLGDEAGFNFVRLLQFSKGDVLDRLPAGITQQKAPERDVLFALG